MLTICLIFYLVLYFFFQAEDGIRDGTVTGVQTCALPILLMSAPSTPTVTPLPARKPSTAVLNRPTTLPRACGGATIWTIAWAIDVNVMFSTDRKSVV